MISSFIPIVVLPLKTPIRRETLLSMYAKIADGKRLDDLISLFLGSQEHPALRQECNRFSPLLRSMLEIVYCKRERGTNMYLHSYAQIDVICLFSFR